MVLRVGANACQIVQHPKAMPSQHRSWPYARQHQQLRCVHSARRQHDLIDRVQLVRFTAVPYRDTGGTPGAQPHALDQRVRIHDQVGPPQHRVKKRARRRQAHAVSLVELVQSEAVLLNAVEIVIASMPGLNRRIGEGQRERVRVGQPLHVELAIDTMPG